MCDPNFAKLTGECDMHVGFTLLGWFMLAVGEQNTSDPA